MEKLVELVLMVSVVIMQCGTQVRSDAKHPHRYKAGDPVPLYVNKVGPFRNPRSIFSTQCQPYIVNYQCFKLLYLFYIYMYI